MNADLTERLRRYTDPKPWETPGHVMNGWTGREGVQRLMNEAADALDGWRALVNGGPCECAKWSKGNGRCDNKKPHKPHRYEAWVDSWVCDGVCDCIDGRTPGLIDRLEGLALCDREMREQVIEAILADLRKAVES